jgi:hypothetical protein
MLIGKRVKKVIYLDVELLIDTNWKMIFKGNLEFEIFIDADWKTVLKGDLGITDSLHAQLKFQTMWSIF